MSATRSSALLRRPEGSYRAADPRTARARTILCAIALGLAPVLLAIAAMVEVNTSNNSGKAAAQILAHRDRFVAGNLLFALGVAALIPGSLALATLVRARGAAWMTTGVCMIALGGGAMAMGIWSMNVVGYLGSAREVPTAAFVAMIHRGDNSAVTGLPWLIGTGALIGMIIAAVGLIRARAMPLWEPILLIIAPVLIFFGNGGVVAGILALPLVVALIALAVEVVRAQGNTDAAEIDLTAAEMPAPRAGSETESRAVNGDRPRTTLS